MYPSGEDALTFIRVGVVSSIDRSKGTAKVLFEDMGQTVSHDLRVIVKNTMNKKEFWMPDAEEEVLCVFLPNGEEVGFILGSPYSDVDGPPPEIDSNSKDGMVCGLRMALL